MEFSFPSNLRLRKRWEFQQVYQNGHMFEGRYVCLYCLSNDQALDVPLRIGLTVSKKVGNAVVRNRLKRLCREIFRSWQFNCVMDTVCVVNIKPRGRHVTYHELRQDLQGVWEQAKCFKN